MLAEYLDWTEKQWEQYEAAKVEIPLSTLAHYIDACELLRDGARLNTEERDAWRELIKAMFPFYMEQLQRISALES